MYTASVLGVNIVNKFYHTTTTIQPVDRTLWYSKSRGFFPTNSRLSIADTRIREHHSISCLRRLTSPFASAWMHGRVFSFIFFPHFFFFASSTTFEIFSSERGRIVPHACIEAVPREGIRACYYGITDIECPFGPGCPYLDPSPLLIHTYSRTVLTERRERRGRWKKKIVPSSLRYNAEAQAAVPPTSGPWMHPRLA